MSTAGYIQQYTGKNGDGQNVLEDGPTNASVVDAVSKAHSNPSTSTTAEVIAGTATTVRNYNAALLKLAAETHGGGSGTMSSQDADDVAITGGSIAGITDLAIADGGTGASTAAAARVALLPSLVGNTGKTLVVNAGADDVAWGAAPGGGTVTSVAVSGGTTGITVTGSPITTSGTVTLGGTLALASGGTGATTLLGAQNALHVADAYDTEIHGFVDDTETSLAFNDTTYTLTLTDTGTGWSYYRDGIKYTITGNKTAVLSGTPPTADRYYFYIDATDGTISSSTSSWTLLDSKVAVAIVCFNNTLTPKYCLQDERHTTGMNKTQHAYEHLTYGTRFQEGAVIDDYVVTPSVPTNANNAYSLTQTIIWDEDLQHTLAPQVAGGTYHVEYRVASDAWEWLEHTVPFRYTASGYIQYDNAGTMTQGVSGDFYNTYLLATNCVGVPRFAIIHGQGEYTTLARAQAEKLSNLDLTGLQFAEVIAVWQITWETKNTYTTLGKCRMAAEPVRITTNIVAASSAPSLGTMSTQNANSVAITGGTITGITDLAVADGGTGASTAEGAVINLLPSMTDNAGKVLTVATGDLTTEWTTPTTGTVTSVALSGGTTGLTVSGSPLTSSGTITLAGTLAVANGGTGSTTEATARTALGVAIGTDVPALAHSHAGTTNGSKLTQANTHESPDTDAATTSLHHTIGTTATTAAAGNHTHTVYAPIAKTQAVDITSSSEVLTLNTAYGINYHLLTEDTVLGVPDTSGWSNGDTARLDLLVKVDAAGSYAMTFNASWKFDGGTAPTLTATAGAVDHLVVTVTKTAGLTFAWIGLAGADIKASA